MPVKRRATRTFGLSFLDIMACGFGAAVLLFLIIKHNIELVEPDTISPPDTGSEVMLLEEEIREGRENLAELKNTIAEVENRIVTAQGLARKITEELNDVSGRREELAAAATDSEIQELTQELKKLEQEKQRLQAQARDSGEDVREFIGEGDRQYLTGIKIGGERILVLVDASASMLDETIVNIIRRRNMPDEMRRQAPKWQWALRTVEWLGARFPADSRFQIYTFNTRADSVIAGTTGQWLDVSDRTRFDQAFENLAAVVPGGGSGLETAFQAISRLSPRPDNIYLLTDSLPTQGTNPPGGNTISGRDRLKLFEQALKRVPANVPINTILFPMEGDPMAAGAFWHLAQISRGSFLIPSEDWP